MSNSFFRFKQFTVHHDLCAMKVGTDGVLLGAWADCDGVKSILDVGTGSGLIALMLAQRSDAIIHAIDKEESACKQARINFENSHFLSRLSVGHCSYQDFATPDKYDLIVSNPPFFTQSLKSPDKERSSARHNDELSFDKLVDKSVSLLAENGKLSLILPYDAFDTIHSLAIKKGLFLCRKTEVSPMEHLPPKRVLLEYSKKQDQIISNAFFIEKSRHHYSDEYIALTKDFYLNM